MRYSQTFFSRQFIWEIVCILTVGIASLLFFLNLIPVSILIITMAFGLYSLVKVAVKDLFKERKIGTEIFITSAVIISVLGKEYLAGSVVLMIILIAEYIASASGEKARASIKGIAMGAIGTEAAMEAADIVLMQDKLEKIALARAIGKRAYRTIRENIFVGVGVVHVTGIILVLLRIIGLVQAAAIHLLPDTLVFINSIKLLRVKIKVDR